MNLEPKFCSKPFDFMEIDGSGNVYTCCSTWLPYAVGNVNEDKSVNEIFNSKISQEIRHSILEGSYEYCNHTLCPYIRNGWLPDKKDVQDDRLKTIIESIIIDDMSPDFYHLCYDESCNLSCPMCRSKVITYSSGPEYEQRLSIHKKVIEELFGQPHERTFTVNITGSGDPFGSKIYRELLFSIKGRDFPNVKINLQTNGVMFTPGYWEKMKGVQKNIFAVVVSFDASNPKTYRQTRRGGNWEILQRNIKFLSQLRQNKQIGFLRIDFVIQDANFKEMPLFVFMGKNLGVDQISFSILYNSGMWNESEFNSRAVWQKTHPNFGEYTEILNNPIFNDPAVVCPKAHST